jgi:hypothetical protein
MWICRICCPEDGNFSCRPLYQCCAYAGLVPSLGTFTAKLNAGHARVQGGEVIKNGNVVAFDVVHNLQREKDGSYTVTLIRMACYPPPPEKENGGWKLNVQKFELFPVSKDLTALTPGEIASRISDAIVIPTAVNNNVGNALL